MPLLATLISALFTGLGSFLLKLFLARLAIRIAAVAAIVAAGGALMAVFNGYVAPLVGAMFSSQYGQFLGLAFPPISGTCITVFTGVWMACMTYKLQVKAINSTAGM